MQSEYANRARFFRFENPMAEVIRFGPKMRRLGPSDFNRKMAYSLKFKVLSTTASNSRTIDELDGGTAVSRRCFAPDAQLAAGASLRGHTTVGWRGLGPGDQEKRTRRAPLRVYVLVHRLQQQQSVTL